MKIIGIVGSRRRDSKEDFELCKKVFFEIYEDGDKIVSGGCKQGGDRFAEIIAKELGLTIENKMLIIHYPEEIPKGSPRWAYAKVNYARNTLIAEDADILEAVVAPNRKGGTEDTIAKALMRDTEIVLVPQVVAEEEEEKEAGDDDPMSEWR